jgi:hypothetical protein
MTLHSSSSRRPSSIHFLSFLRTTTSTFRFLRLGLAVLGSTCLLLRGCRRCTVRLLRSSGFVMFLRGLGRVEGLRRLSVRGIRRSTGVRKMGVRISVRMNVENWLRLTVGGRATIWSRLAFVTWRNEARGRIEVRIVPFRWRSELSHCLNGGGSCGCGCCWVRVVPFALAGFSRIC